MSYQRHGDHRSSSAAAAPASGEPVPGKRTLTEARGAGQALPGAVRAGMEQSFGVDFSAVRIHEGPAAPAIGALAYTEGADIHVAPGCYDPASRGGLELLGHELAHVVQQAEGRVTATTQAKGLAANDDDALEREADELGVRAARGERVRSSGAVIGGGGGAIQRFAFVRAQQVAATAPALTPAMQAMVADDQVRDYQSQAEFAAHAAGGLDYLGNLPDGTWLRFKPTGINLVGENHTDVTLEDVLPAVGSNSFIYEPFASDQLEEGSALAEAYQAQNEDRFAALGVDGPPDAAHGAESLYPKLGVSMGIVATACGHDKGSADTLAKLTTAGGYLGQAMSRALRMAWAHVADLFDKHADPSDSGEVRAAPREQALVAVYAAQQGPLGKLIAGLTGDTFLGDPLTEAPALKAPLVAFAQAYLDATVEAAANPANGLSARQRKKLAGMKQGTNPEKSAMLWAWRDLEFKKAVDAATGRGVRYAGMGQLHLDELVEHGLQGGQHAFNLGRDDLATFQARTQALAATAEAPADAAPAARASSDDR